MAQECCLIKHAGFSWQAGCACGTGFEVNNKAVKVAECSEQADSELANAKTAGLEQRIGESQSRQQAQAVRLAQVRERLELIEGRCTGYC